MCVLIAYSPEATFNMSKISVLFFSSLKGNVMQTRCYSFAIS
jgi:hypothetical protein